MSIVKNQNTDTVVVSMTGSVEATSELTANCIAYNEFGTVNASHDIEASEFLFSDNILYVYFVHEYCYHI